MARIRRAKRPGEPRFTTRSVEGFTGEKVSSDRASKRGVRRLFARDPNQGAFMNFGTKRDILDFTNHEDVPNPNAGSSPRILSGSQARVSGSPFARTAQKVRNRATNRRIRRS